MIEKSLLLLLPLIRVYIVFLMILYLISLIFFQNYYRSPADQLDEKLMKMADKMDRRFEKLQNKTDSWLSKKINSAGRTYRKYILGDENSIYVDELYLINMYILAFSAGTMLGLATGKLF